MVGVNRVKKNKAFGNLGYRWDEKIQIKHEDKKNARKHSECHIQTMWKKRIFPWIIYDWNLRERGKRKWGHATSQGNRRQFSKSDENTNICPH